jgi:hypothetical protein
VRNGVTICLSGPNVPETAKALTVRLVQMGRQVELADGSLAERLGSRDALAVVCGLLSRNGIIVVAPCDGVTPEGETMPIEIDPNDTPDFAAEKILDDLGEAGLVDLESDQYSPEEEEKVRQRLADLGYVE